MKRKKIISLLLSATVAASMAGASAAPVFAADSSGMEAAGKVMHASAAQTVTVSSEDELAAAITNASEDAANPTVITISSNLSLEKEVTIPAGKYVTLTGGSSSKTIKITGSHNSARSSDTEAFLTVKGTLAVDHLTIDGNNMMRVITVNEDASLTLNNGAVITGGHIGQKAQMNGSGILLKGRWQHTASLVMNDGAQITGNTSGGAGGVDYTCNGLGVYMLSQSSFIMNGGSVSGNIDGTTENVRKACNGGGVFLAGDDAVFTMNGGSISNNSAKKGGGGLYISEGTATINNGTISGNSTYTSGGGIFTLDKLTINNGTISNNKAEATKAIPETEIASYGNGGGIYIGNQTENHSTGLSADGVVTMNGGTISGNSAASTFVDDSQNMDIGQGGGIYNSATFIMNGGIITGNSSTASDEKEEGKKGGSGGGISTAGGDAFGRTVLNGGSITGNQAGGHGADLYLNAYKVTADSMYNSETMESAPGILEVAGPVQTGEAYLPKGLFFTVTAETSKASIGVDDEENLSDVVIAQGSNYTLTDDDVKGFYSLADGYEVKRTDNTLTLDENRDYVSIRDAQVAPIEDQVYTGSLITPKAAVTLNGQTLTEGTDYVLSYSGNLDVGTATVTVRGIGTYGGTVTQTFTIKKDTNLENYQVQLSKSSFTFNGSNQRPDVTVVWKKDTSVVLGEDGNYTVSYPKNTRNASSSGYTVKVTGQGDYTGTISAKFKIKKASLKKVTYKFPNQKYTGKKITYVPAYGTIKLGKYKLLRGSNQDYTIVKNSYKKNKKKGTATFKIKGAANFTGTKTVKFKIVK